MLGRQRQTGTGLNGSNCTVHAFVSGSDSCGRCHDNYCTDCLVYPFGSHRAPMCIQCALVAAGVRRPARKPVFSF